MARPIGQVGESSIWWRVEDYDDEWRTNQLSWKPIISDYATEVLVITKTGRRVVYKSTPNWNWIYYDEEQGYGHPGSGFGLEYDEVVANIKTLLEIA